jgi:hypothetical protein
MPDEVFDVPVAASPGIVNDSYAGEPRVLPTGKTKARAEVYVFIVEEVALVESAELAEHARAEKHE